MKFYAGIGSRSTPAAIQSLMTIAARSLCTQDWTLRTGGAEGADMAFSMGAGRNQVVYLPWESFGDFHTLADTVVVPESPAASWAMKIAEQFHPAWDRLSPAARKLMARNTCQVLGMAEGSPPSKFVMCWTPGASGSGGTGQAIRIAKAYGIPVFDLADPGTLARVRRWKV